MATKRRVARLSLLVLALLPASASAQLLLTPISTSGSLPSLPQTRVRGSDQNSLAFVSPEGELSRGLHQACEPSCVGIASDYAFQPKSTGPDPIRWVDEHATMSPEARAYQSGAEGSRSNRATRVQQAPEISFVNEAGAAEAVRFDGVDGRVLIDRKISVTTFPKSQRQALHQSRALKQNGLTGRWEVPTQTEKVRALRMFQRLGIDNIVVKVVPKS